MTTLIRGMVMTRAFDGLRVMGFKAEVDEDLEGAAHRSGVDDGPVSADDSVGARGGGRDDVSCRLCGGGVGCRR
jgi:hypothetical protein